MKVKGYKYVKVAYFCVDNLEENKSNEYTRFFERAKEMDSE